MNLSPNAQLAADALAMRPVKGVPQWLLNVMEHRQIDHFSGRGEGAYACDYEGTYIAFQRAIGTCMIDQYIPDNPLTMGTSGYESSTQRTATTGAEEIRLDGILIDSPEAVIEHMERFAFPTVEKQTAATPNADTPEGQAAADTLIAAERAVQEKLGPDILKCPYGWKFSAFPIVHYGRYGYANYLMAYALYPEMMERDFSLQSKLWEKTNAIAALAIRRGNLPAVIRLDHDLADSRGTLVDVKSLDQLWFPHVARSLRPLLDAGVRLIWHCDGNLMDMVPRLIEIGVSGFQGFQYEDGMDYLKICGMKDRCGDPLMIWAGVSVTRTLPFGRPADVRAELKWLAENGPAVGLFLGASSSITPGVPRENLQALVEGLNYYRTHGR